jgi:hypothetical protein
MYFLASLYENTSIASHACSRQRWLILFSLDGSSHGVTLITAIIVAIVALVSTIVGATIGAVTNYILAVRRERADSDKDNRSHAIEVRRAAGMIDAELLRAQAAAVICIEQRHWWSGDVQPLATEVWKKYSAIIAADLSDQAWNEVIVAVDAIDHIREARDRRVEAGLPIDEPISDRTAEQLAPMLRDIRAGRGTLGPFVLDSHSQTI